MQLKEEVRLEDFSSDSLFQKFDENLSQHLQIFYPAIALDKKNIAQIKLGCAYSGGADSLLLTILCAAWFKKYAPAAAHQQVIAFHVDHHLRPESSQEAQQAASLLAPYGIGAEILTQEHHFTRGNIQHQARLYRYELLQKACMQHDILFLLVGHHGDDTEENFWLNLKRGSGLYGLSAMRSQNRYQDMHLIRPLKDMQSQQIRTYLKTHQIPYISDASNNSLRFARVRLRKIRPLLQEEGFLPQRIIRTAEQLQMMRAVIEKQLVQIQARYCHYHPAGFMKIALTSLLRSEPEPLILKLLAEEVARLGKGYPPRYQKLCALLEKLKADKPLKGDHIAAISCWQKGEDLFLLPAYGKEQPIDDFFTWQSPAETKMKLDWLGQEGIKQWQDSVQDLVPERMRFDAIRTSLPPFIMRHLPAFFMQGKLMAVPFFNYSAADNPHPPMLMNNVYFHPPSLLKKIKSVS